MREFHCDPIALEARLAAIRSGGVPNYFGEQRFGRDGGNLEAVWREAQNPRGGRAGRGRDDQRGFMLSAARSLIFNAMLADRVHAGTWNRLSVGDVANLDGRGSVFVVDAIDAALQARCEALEIHPTAPLVGETSMAMGEVLRFEDTVMARYPEAMAVIGAARMNSERRALRIRVRDLTYHYQSAVLRLEFALASGSFATTVLREIMAGAATGE